MIYHIRSMLNKLLFNELKLFNNLIALDFQLFRWYDFINCVSMIVWKATMIRRTAVEETGVSKKKIVDIRINKNLIQKRKLVASSEVGDATLFCIYIYLCFHISFFSLTMIKMTAGLKRLRWWVDQKWKQNRRPWKQKTKVRL